MTSSLVGSEMCIRDRPLAAVILWILHGTLGRLGVQWGLKRAANSASLEVVSYTHLTLPTICSV
eukprot:2257529-Prorocentrum_lima.AAC.1